MQNKQNAIKWIVNIVRFITASLFIFSGFVKAVDPLGTQYKINDYLNALGLDSLVSDIITLPASMLVSAFEFSCGVFLLFAAYRRLTTRLLLAFMIPMSFITLWIVIADPVSDCGCFGDALVISNTATFIKNIILLVFTIVLCVRYRDMILFVRRSAHWVIINYTVIFILFVSGYSLYFLPQFDFRPYHIGADIVKGMEIPEDAELPEFKTTFILEKNGETKEFSLDNYPDSTWKFIDSKTSIIKKGYEPPIHDFNIISVESGEDLTSNILEDSSFVFLLISPYLDRADDSNFGEIDRIYEFAVENNYRFYGVTSSGIESIARWRDITGAEYEFCNADATTLKTIIRSNPGLLLLKKGVVIGKWSHNSLSSFETSASSMDNILSEFNNRKSLGMKIFEMLLWFFMPLVILTLADRLYDIRGKFAKKRNKDKIQ